MKSGYVKLILILSQILMPLVGYCFTKNIMLGYILETIRLCFLTTYFFVVSSTPYVLGSLAPLLSVFVIAIILDLNDVTLKSNVFKTKKEFLNTFPQLVFVLINPIAIYYSLLLYNNSSTFYGFVFWGSIGFCVIGTLGMLTSQTCSLQKEEECK